MISNLYFLTLNIENGGPPKYEDRDTYLFILSMHTIKSIRIAKKFRPPGFVELYVLRCSNCNLTISRICLSLCIYVIRILWPH